MKNEWLKPWLMYFTYILFENQFYFFEYFRIHKFVSEEDPMYQMNITGWNLLCILCNERQIYMFVTVVERRKYILNANDYLLNWEEKFYVKKIKSVFLNYIFYYSPFSKFNFRIK